MQPRPHLAITIRAAGELTGLGEPAIRQAFRQGRISPAFFWHIGGTNTATYLNLASVVTAYGVVDATVQSNIERMSGHAPTITTQDGETWVILDTCDPLMFREGRQ